MATRRKFIGGSVAACLGVLFTDRVASSPEPAHGNPLVISTWDHGLAANKAAWTVLSQGGYALDAVETGVRVTEADPEVTSVGYGGLPDRNGKVTLDASIMDEKGNAGSVACLEHIKHPVSVARLVMEKTPYVLLTGQGALSFALQNGFVKENLLTPYAKKAWQEWKKSGKDFQPVINIENELHENHDTIGMLAIDQAGRLCGACTTSGMAFKMSGRVGDSPIIGAGLYVDGETGAATATGTGELVMKTLGSFLVVELMKNGFSPGDACREAVIRITKKIPGYHKHQIGFIAVNTFGQTGAFSLQPGFAFAIATPAGNQLVKVASIL